jgi:hypothetical protein
MARKRGSSHTTLTDTADIVVRELEKTPGIKMIAPGVIVAKRSGIRFITVVYTSGGFELIISGTGVQKVSVHLVEPRQAKQLVSQLQSSKNLKPFSWNERSRKPGI